MEAGREPAAAETFIEDDLITVSGGKRKGRRRRRRAARVSLGPPHVQ